MGEMNGVNVSEMGLLEFQEYCESVNVSEMGLLEFQEYCESVNVSEMDMHEFAMFCKKCNERWNNPQTEAERLVYEIAGNKKRKTN